MDPDQLIILIEHRAWVPASALIVAAIVRLLKSDTKLPIDVPPRARVWLAFGLGLVSGVLEHVVAGKTWTSALIGGVISAGLAVIGHEAIIASLRGGKELPVPGLMVPGARPAPTAPVTVPPPPTDDAKVTPIVLNPPKDSDVT